MFDTLMVRASLKESFSDILRIAEGLRDNFTDAEWNELHRSLEDARKLIEGKIILKGVDENERD